MKHVLKRLIYILCTVTMMLSLCAAILPKADATTSVIITFTAGSSEYAKKNATLGEVVTLPEYTGVIPENHEFIGWTTAPLEATQELPTIYTAGDGYRMVTQTKTFYALFSHGDLSGKPAYFLTEAEALSPTDAVVITMKVGDTVYAMSNANGTASSPRAIALEVEDNAITSYVSDCLNWNVLNDNGTLTIHPEGTTAKWLYCSGNPRVGTVAAYQSFQIIGNFLYASRMGRYVGVRTSDSSWIGASTNYDTLAGQVIGLYRRAGGSVTYYTTNVNTCSHSWVIESTVAPTCTVGGYSNMACSLCGETKRANHTDATGHTYVLTTVAPTASEQGYDDHICACGESYQDNFVAALGESNTVSFRVPNGVNAISDIQSNRLGITLPTPVGAPSDSEHDYVFLGWVPAIVTHSATAPAFLKAGSSYTASGDMVFRALYAYSVGGSIGTPSLTLLASADAVSDGDKLVITGSGSEYGMSLQTAAQSSTHLANFPFTGDANDITAEQILTVQVNGDGTWNLTDGAGSSLYNPAENLNLSVSAENGNAWTPIDLGDGTFALQSGSHYLTCRTDITTTYANLWRTCSNTAASLWALDLYRYNSGMTGSVYYTTVIGDQTHTHSVRFTEGVGATCLENGTASYFSCTDPSCPEAGRCFSDEALTVELPSLTIAATGHSIVSIPAVAASCTTDGLTEGTRCAVCGKILTAQTTITAPGHTYTDSISVENTCTTDGVRTFRCTGCGDTYTEVIPACGHHYEASVSYASSCTDAETIVYTCALCADTYTVELPGTDHELHYTDNGADHTVTCANCAYNVTEAHIFTNGVCACGATESTEAVLDTDLNFLSNSFSMGAALEMVYQFSQPNANAYTDAYVVIEKDVYGGEPIVKTVQKADFVKLGSVRYRISFTDISAKEMGDNFRATVYGVDANGKLFCGKTIEISIASYVMDILNNPDTAAKVKSLQLCVDLLNYGAAAQAMFSYNTENPANAQLSDAQKALGTQTLPTAVNAQRVSGSGSCSFMRVSPSLGSKVTMVAMYNLSAYLTRYTELDVVVTDAQTGKELSRSKLERASATSSMGKAYFDDISAGKMRTLLNIAVFDGSTQVSQTLTWSVESYVASLLDNAATDDAMRTLCKTMLCYGDAAAVYLAN